MRVKHQWMAGLGITALIVAAPAWAAKPRLATSRNPKWDSESAAHLLRRAGFGGPPQQIQHLTRLGRDEAVGLLVDYESTPQHDPDFPSDVFGAPPPPGTFRSLDADQKRQLRRVLGRRGRQNGQAMRDWWVQRMIVTARPFEEKMTLFWHGHFTSGLREVKRANMILQQNAFLRQHALNDFETLLKGISRDPAMLVYLDNARNVKSHPNENYARELLELFTMGEGNYTEQDVTEAARAFTGWTLSGFGKKGPRRGPVEFVIRSNKHDNAAKSFLGRTGNFNGDDIIDIILQEPATAHHLARKIWTFFVEPEPDESIIEALALEIRRTDYDLREIMRTVFRSDAFYAPDVRKAMIKSPTELVVGTLRLLETSPGDMRAVNQAMGRMGQVLFQPPNVKGWPGGRAWISTSTLLARYNSMAGLVHGTQGNRRQMANRKFTVQRAALGIGQPQEGEKNMAPTRRPPRRRQDADSDQPQDRNKPAERRMAIASMVDALPQEAKEWLGQLPPPPEYSHAQEAYDPSPLIRRNQIIRPESIVNNYVWRLLQTDISVARKKTLVDVLVGQDSPFDALSPEGVQRIRSMIHLILSMPEYQLN